MKRFTLLFQALKKIAFVVFLSMLFSNLAFTQTITSFIQATTVNPTTFTTGQSTEYQKIQNSTDFLSTQFIDLGNLATEAADGKLDINIPGYGCGDMVFGAEMVRYNSESDYYWYG